MNNPFDKIFILHYEPLFERRPNIDDTLSKEFFADKTKIWVSNRETDEKLLEKCYFNPNRNTQMLRGGKALAMTFYSIFEYIVENDLNHCLLMEDDAIVNDNFYNQDFTDLFDSIPEDSDCCFFAECCGLVTNGPLTNKYFQKRNDGRCATGFSIRKSTCEKILSRKEFWANIDWHLTFMREELNLNFYWSSVIVFNQGSYGAFTPSYILNR